MPIHKLTCFLGSAGIIISGGVAGTYVAMKEGSAAEIVVASATGGISGLIVAALAAIVYYKCKLRAGLASQSEQGTRSESDLYESVHLNPRPPTISPSSSAVVASSILNVDEVSRLASIEASEKQSCSPRTRTKI